MASYSFRNIRGPVTTMSSPSLHMRPSPGPTFGQNFGYFLEQNGGKIGSVAGSIGSIADFIQNMTKEPTVSSGMSGAARANQQIASQNAKVSSGVLMFLQLLSPLLMFI